MNKLSLWMGVVIAVLALTLGGHKSLILVLCILGYIGFVCLITFGGGGSKITKGSINKANLSSLFDTDFSAPRSK